MTIGVIKKLNKANYFVVIPTKIPNKLSFVFSLKHEIYEKDKAEASMDEKRFRWSLLGDVRKWRKS